VALEDVVYTRADKEPHCFTVKLKTPLFNRKRKWRLVCISRAQAEKALKEIRRVSTSLSAPAEDSDDD